MNNAALWRVIANGEPRLARGPADQGPQELLARELTVGALLDGSGPTLSDLGSLPSACPIPANAASLTPIDEQVVWASGVTFERSREARKQESGHSDFYDRVYEAERPELFLKALPGNARGSGDPIGIRSDSTWDVPEPELGIVADSSGNIVGYVLGNDVSSRSIEGENPLYLPQAKIYEGSCAIGPCIVPAAQAPQLAEINVTLTICRNGAVLYADTVALARMHRSADELVDWLFRAQKFPRGVVLLSGTSIVPDPDLTLRSRDEVRIAADGLGELVNVVEVV